MTYIRPLVGNVTVATKNDSQILLNDLGVLLGIHLCLESLDLHTNGTQTFGKGSLQV